MFGCRQSGSFSFYLQLPQPDVSIRWISDLKYEPVPTPLGCVSDSYSVVCQYNNLFKENQGYVSLYPVNGSLRWQDKVLHYPPLPLLDAYGDVTGSDGTSLVHYDQDGTKYPVIPCEDLTPIFSTALVGDNTQYLLFVSGNGNIVVRQPDGIPVASLTLNATVNDINGLFVPVAQPVVFESRFYVLTMFKPLSLMSKITMEVLRLYAIDVHESISDRITIGWHVAVNSTELPFRKKKNDAYVFNSSSQALLFDRETKQVYVAIKPSNMLFAFKDLGKTVEEIFRKLTPVDHMTKFVKDHCSANDVGCNDKKALVSSHSLLWVLTSLNTIVGLDSNGSINKKYDLAEMFGMPINVTSLVTSVKNDDTENEILIFAFASTNTYDERSKFAINVSTNGYHASFKYSKSRLDNLNAGSYVLALDTGKEPQDNGAIRWMVPVPMNMVVRGQITGTAGQDTNTPDQLVAYAEAPGRSAVIFTIA